MNKLKLALPTVAGLMLAFVVIFVRTDAPNGDEQTAQQVAEPKLVRPDDVEHLFEVPKPMSFDTYRQEFNKQYATESERLMRETIYTANQARALRSQAAYLLGAQDYFLGPTQFSDRTKKEIRDQLCPGCDDDDADQSAGEQRVENKPGRRSEADSGESVAADKGQAGLPLRASQATTRMVRGRPADSVDLTGTDCFVPPKHQLGCDASYAFTVVAALEYLYCRTHDNQPVSFSEQFMIDCGNPHEHQIYGCIDGGVTGAIRFSHQWGIFSDNAYIYSGEQQSCGASQNDAPNLLGSEEYEPVSPEFWVNHIGSGRPVMIATYVNVGEYALYHSGVLEPSGASRDRPHYVLAVGFAAGSSGYAFKMRNSFGPQWGMGGYFYMRFSSDYMGESGYVLAGLNNRPDSEIQLRQQRRRGRRLF
jgi:hypothetical protein